MAENTVEVGGVQFNAENLLAALEDVLDEPDGEGSSINGTVVVEDDGHKHDNGVNLTELDSCSIVTYKNAETLVQKCEEAIEQPFEEYVEDKTTLVGRYGFTSPETHVKESSDLRVVDSDLVEHEIESIVNDENIGISIISTSIEGLVEVELIDQR